MSRSIDQAELDVISTAFTVSFTRSYTQYQLRFFTGWGFGERVCVFYVYTASPGFSATLCSSPKSATSTTSTSVTETV